ncbi:hypothetical protein [Streptomyces sp. NPDC059009]|uniref:hypothetical protein n=1 Tax=Streptomyces sp. NPDC059009 TaxID=3346694 RepID=UPI0036A0BB9E
MATIADLDITPEQLKRRIREGALAHERHLLHDPDPDSPDPHGFPDLRKGIKGGAR